LTEGGLSFSEEAQSPCVEIDGRMDILLHDDRTTVGAKYYRELDHAASVSIRVAVVGKCDS
jgi:hypothetical protein